jgi:hypothetical protein
LFCFVCRKVAACQENDPTWLDLVAGTGAPTDGSEPVLANEEAAAAPGGVSLTEGEREMAEWLEANYGQPSSFEKPPPGTYSDKAAAGGSGGGLFKAAGGGV